MERFLHDLPKAELHIHIEGALEPELMLELAGRNGVELPFKTVEEVRAAYEFNDLQSFLDVYYEGAKVLLREADFFDLAWEYLKRAAVENVRRAEIFFDPQAHTDRGVPFDAVFQGLHRAVRKAGAELGVSAGLIPCFLRHLRGEDAMRSLERVLPFKDRILAVGLDSTERRNPPERFQEVFARARQEGIRTVAHAGEEGPPDYIRQALDLLEVDRIDHGVRCAEDPALVERLKAERIPLTVCPLSNIRLRVFRDLKDHNIKELLDKGLCVTVNSDDPAYFGGYVTDNYAALRDSLGLSADQLKRLAKNSFEASFLDEQAKRRFIAEVDACPVPKEG